jgi:murein DD-endopeptidase MepM/ murein hydrolase activator NlpD
MTGPKRASPQVDTLRPGLRPGHKRNERARARTDRAGGPAIKAGARTLIGAVAAVFLVATYVLPAYATQQDAASLVRPRPAAANQNVHLAPSEFSPLGPMPRDMYTVTKPEPVHIAGFTLASFVSNFSNNPKNTIIQWPFDRGVPILSGFGPRSSPCLGCSAFHDGLDMAGGRGTPVQAIADGVVSEVGNPNGSFGVYAIIEHVIDGKKVTSLYGHMLLGSLTIAVGDRITKGEELGKVGSTGASTGPHLHFGIYLGGTQAIDPWPWMKQKVGS